MVWRIGGETVYMSEEPSEYDIDCNGYNVLY